MSGGATVPSEAQMLKAKEDRECEAHKQPPQLHRSKHWAARTQRQRAKKRRKS